MPSFANESDFAAGLDDARRGIIAPRRQELTVGTVLYRFADTEILAMRGNWWLEEAHFSFIRNWAILHNLPLANAVRALCAVAHEWGAMVQLVRAQVKSPLLAYEGRGSPQSIQHDGKITEFFDPAASRTAATLRQLYIPGLRDTKVGNATLIRISVQPFGRGDSEIGGVKGFPAGAVIQ